jgi:ABC-type sugar transport system permease subunit
MAFQIIVDYEKVWSTKNFEWFFSELANPSSEIYLAFINTFKTFGINIIMYFVSFFVSYFLYKQIPGHTFYRICFFLPSVLAATVTSQFFMKLVSVKGPVAPILQQLLDLPRLPDIFANERFANSAVFINLIWLSFPSNMILLGGAFSRIPTSVIESAQLDGISWIREAVSIIVPLVWPTFGLLLMLSIIGIFGATGNVFLFTKGTRGTITLNVWMYLRVYENVSSSDFENNIYNQLSALGMMITTVSLVLSVVIRKINSKVFADVSY